MGLNNFTTPGNNTNASGPGQPGLPAGMFPGPGQGADDVVDDLLVNYNQRFATADPTLFRDKVIELTIAALIGKTKPNALLVGPAGVGKTKIVEDIARRIAVGDTLIPAQLKDYTIYELPISNLIAGSAIVGMIEEKVKAVVDFVSDPKNKAILFMDEIHQAVGGAGGGRDSTYSKIAQILKPPMARGDMRVIGATTTQEARALDDDPAFRRRFSRLVVDELSPSQTVTVLHTVRTSLMAHYKQQITISDDVLECVVRVADENAHAGAHRPDTAITLLDRAMAERVIEQQSLITKALNQGDTVGAQALQAITQYPLTSGRVTDVARRMLTGTTVRKSVDVHDLAANLTDVIKGQDNVLDQLVEIIRREELGLFPRTTPIAWMFAGASGVGKTQTAKILAQQVTGQDPIVLNMTEYHHESSISRIIGAPPGYVGSTSNAELPFDSLESNPYRVILLDEFEKADRAVQRLFLQALDEGRLATSQGKTIDFSRSILIATTNAARESLEGSHIGFGAESRTISTRSLTVALKSFFDAELLGRFSLVVGFNPINETTFGQIIETDYAAQRERIVTANPRLAQILPDRIPVDDVAGLVEQNFVASLGARPAGRAVRTWIEDCIYAATLPQQAAASAQMLQERDTD